MTSSCGRNPLNTDLSTGCGEHVWHKPGCSLHKNACEGLSFHLFPLLESNWRSIAKFTQLFVKETSIYSSKTRFTTGYSIAYFSQDIKLTAFESVYSRGSRNEQCFFNLVMLLLPLTDPKWLVCKIHSLFNTWVYLIWRSCSFWQLSQWLERFVCVNVLFLWTICYANLSVVYNPVSSILRNFLYVSHILSFIKQ